MNVMNELEAYRFDLTLSSSLTISTSRIDRAPYLPHVFFSLVDRWDVP